MNELKIKNIVISESAKGELIFLVPKSDVSTWSNDMLIDIVKIISDQASYEFFSIEPSECNKKAGETFKYIVENMTFNNENIIHVIEYSLNKKNDLVRILAKALKDREEKVDLNFFTTIFQDDVSTIQSHAFLNIFMKLNNDRKIASDSQNGRQVF